MKVNKRIDKAQKFVDKVKSVLGNEWEKNTIAIRMDKIHPKNILEKRKKILMIILISL